MKPKTITALEWVTASFLTVVVLFFIVLRATHAGALWRDEAGTIQLAQMPSISEIAANFQHEGFPIPFPLLLRTYAGIFGNSDASLRCFGAAVGVALLIAAWFNARILGNRGPVLFLALFGLNISFLRWGTSLRGYGIGCVLLTAAIGLTAKAIREPTRANAITATLAGSASMQFMINAVPLIAAIGASATLVFFVSREFGRAVVVCLCGAICALSFLPYLPSYLNADWNIVLQYPTEFISLWQKLQSALAEQGTTIFWYLALAAILLAAIWRLWNFRRERSSAEHRVLLFLIGVAVLSIFAYYAFLRILNYPTRAWYYLPILCTVATAIDLAAGILSRMAWFRMAQLVFVIAALVLIPVHLWKVTYERLTDMDVIARKLEQEAAPSDLIVVNPWHYAPSFYRNYHGQTRWITVPATRDHRFHHYDELKEKMIEANPLREVLVAITLTLKSNGNVWLVGGARPPEPGLPLSIQPAPDPNFGWSGAAYVTIWSMQLADFLQKHVVEGTTPLLPAENVNPDENVALLVARGWQE